MLRLLDGREPAVSRRLVDLSHIVAHGLETHLSDARLRDRGMMAP